MEISKNYKRNKLQGLCENELRKTVVVPLLTKMQYFDCVENHSSNEKGKDIICKEYDERYDSFRYIAVIIKASDITGSSSNSKSIFNIMVQVKQAINEPYKDIYNLSEINIDKCIIITSGRILPQALEAIYSTLKREHLDKLISAVVDIEKLISLIDRHFPEYWLEDENQLDILCKEKNILLNNLVKVVKALSNNSIIIDKISSMIFQQNFDIDIDRFYSISSFIADVSYDKIKIDKINSYYKSNIPIEDIDDIPSETYRIKEIAASILYEMDEVIEVLKSIICEDDPKKIIEKCTSLKNNISANDCFRFNAHGIYAISDYYYYIKNYCERKQYLIDNKLFDIHNMILDDAERKLEVELKTYYKDKFTEDKEYWCCYKFKIINSDKNIFISEINSFKRKIIEVLRYNFKMKVPILKRIYKNNEDYIVIELAINWYYYDERKSNLDTYIKDIVHLFAISISNCISGYEEDDEDY